MPFGPTPGNFLFLFGVPLIIASVTAFAMLFSRRTFEALVISCLIGVGWLVSAFTFLGAGMDVLMLTFSAWFFVVVLGINLSPAVRQNHEAATLADEGAAENRPPPQQKATQPCPACTFSMPADVEGCPVCKLKKTRFSGISF